MLADLLFLVIVGYVLYRFVYGFVVPLMRASKQVRNQFRNMQQGPSSDFGAGAGPGATYGGQQQNSGATYGGQQQGPPPKRTSKPPADDYIDFEEIK